MDQLQEVLKFTSDDLLYNLQGEISPEQRRRLYREQFTSFVFAVLLGAFLYGIWNIAKGQINLYLLIMVVIVGFAFWSFLNTVRDVRNNHVEVVEGMASLQITRSRNSRNYYATFDNQTFKITRRVYQTLEGGISYRVYYLPNSRQIIAAEKLET